MNTTEVPQQQPLTLQDLNTLIVSVIEKIKEANNEIKASKLEADKEYQAFKKKSEEEYQAFKQKSEEEYQAFKQKSEEEYKAFKQELNKEYEASKQELDKKYQASKEELNKEYQASKQEFNKEYEAFKLESEKELKASKLETEKSRRETDKKFKELATRFTSQTGHIVEGLMEPAAMNLFKKAGFDIDKCWKEMKGKNKAIGREMEVDLFYYDTTEAIAVEVKTNCKKADIDHFLSQMSHFKEIFTNFNQVKIYAAIAAINYDRNSDQYANEQGLFVIRVSDNDIFTLDAADKTDRISF